MGQKFPSALRKTKAGKVDREGETTKRVLENQKGGRGRKGKRKKNSD